MDTKTLGQLLVGCQLLGMGSSVYALRFTPQGSKLFLLFTLAGAVLGVMTIYYNQLGNFSILPEPLPRARLIIKGPYRFIRHPMYLSVILLLLGLALFTKHLIGYAGLVMASVSVIWKSYLEEKYLESKFAEYKQYKTQTKRIIPFVL